MEVSVLSRSNHLCQCSSETRTEYIDGHATDFQILQFISSFTAFQLINLIHEMSLLATIALSAVQSSSQTFIHNVILFIDTSDNA